MKGTIYAVLAACLAMLATSGVVAFATAAPSDSVTMAQAEEELVAELDGAIARQLAGIKERLRQ